MDATPDEVRAWNIDTIPRGQGLPLCLEMRAVSWATGVKGLMDPLVDGRQT